MTRKRNSDGVKPVPKKTIRIAVVYENPAAREHVLRSGPGLTGGLSAEAGCAVQWWSFDKLCDAAFSTEAVNGAAAADLLVFAITPKGDLAQEIKLWIEQWICQRREREGTVVGLVLTERRAGLPEKNCLKEIYLRHAAHRAGMDYLSQLPSALPKAMPDSIDSYREREGRMSSVLDDILHLPPPPPMLLR